MIRAEKKFMQAAIAEALNAKKHHEYAIGAVVEYRGEILAMSPNVTRFNNDPTRHAELEVMKLALRKMKKRFLQDCVLYTTHEPCPMCTTAAIWVKLKGIVFGARLSDMSAFSKKNGSNAFRWRTVKITASEVISKGEPKLELVEDFMRLDCIKLFHS